MLQSMLAANTILSMPIPVGSNSGEFGTPVRSCAARRVAAYVHSVAPATRQTPAGNGRLRVVRASRQNAEPIGEKQDKPTTTRAIANRRHRERQAYAYVCVSYRM